MRLKGWGIRGRILPGIGIYTKIKIVQPGWTLTGLKKSYSINPKASFIIFIIIMLINVATIKPDIAFIGSIFIPPDLLHFYSLCKWAFHISYTRHCTTWNLNMWMKMGFFCFVVCTTYFITSFMIFVIWRCQGQTCWLFCSLRRTYGFGYIVGYNAPLAYLRLFYNYI